MFRIYNQQELERLRYLLGEFTCSPQISYPVDIFRTGTAIYGITYGVMDDAKVATTAADGQCAVGAVSVPDTRAYIREQEDEFFSGYRDSMPSVPRKAPQK